MNTYLKRCISEDFDVLRELSIRTYYETFAHLNTPEDMQAYLDEAFETNKFRNELEDCNCEFYFLFYNELLAGYLKLNEAPSQSDINDTDSLEIERIYITDEFQGAGLGSFMMKQAIEKAIAKNKKYVWLGVWEKNQKALNFYRRNGFYETSTHIFMMGEDAQTDFIMRKDLI